MVHSWVLPRKLPSLFAVSNFVDRQIGTLQSSVLIPFYLGSIHTDDLPNADILLEVVINHRPLHRIMDSETNNGSNKPSTVPAPKFEWDFDVPDTPFWKGLEFTVARNFITCYQPQELQSVSFDEHATLPVSDRLHFLLSELHTLLSVREAAAAPQSLHIAHPDQWRRLQLGIETMQKFLGLSIDEAQTIRNVLKSTEGDARVPWLNMLADLDLRTGFFAEAEVLAREVLPWMQKHEKLGFDSPQAFGTTRMLIKSMWKQGGDKEQEARRLVAETETLIGDMRKGKFGKYQDEERKMLRDLVAELEGRVG